MLDTVIITEDEFYDNLRANLNESVIASAASALGYANITGLALFGAAMLAKSTFSKQGKIRRFFNKLFKRKDKRELDFETFGLRGGARREAEKVETWEDKMPEVFNAISIKDWNSAREFYRKSRYYENEDAVKAIIVKVADITGEPPMFVYPSGNETYFILKRIVEIKYAKAAANAVVAALRQNKSYYNDLKDQDLKVNNEN